MRGRHLFRGACCPEANMELRFSKYTNNNRPMHCFCAQLWNRKLFGFQFPETLEVRINFLVSSWHHHVIAKGNKTGSGIQRLGGQMCGIVCGESGLDQFLYTQLHVGKWLFSVWYTRQPSFLYSGFNLHLFSLIIVVVLRLSCSIDRLNYSKFNIFPLVLVDLMNFRSMI